MFEGNCLSVTCRLGDLERQFAPQIKDFRAEKTTPRFYAQAAVFVLSVVALTFGAVNLI